MRIATFLPVCVYERSVLRLELVFLHSGTIAQFYQMTNMVNLTPVLDLISYSHKFVCVC